MFGNEYDVGAEYERNRNREYEYGDGASRVADGDTRGSRAT